MYFSLAVSVTVTCTLFLTRGVVSVSDEKKLHDQLFYQSGYDKFTRPVRNYTDTIEVEFTLSLSQILDVDEKNQILRTSCWLEQIWYDYQLEWNPVDYSDITVVVIPYDWVWRPDIVLDNSANGEYQIPPPQYITVQYDGLVYYSPPAIFMTPCTMNIEYFPMDIQTCKIAFGTWEYTSEQVLLKAGQSDIVMEKYTNNTEWDFIFSEGFTSTEYLECCPGEPFTLMVYNIVLKRRPLYYSVNITAMCLLLSALTLLVFCLPPDSGEKISFSMSLLIASSVFNLMVADIMPVTSETVPMLLRYLMFNTFLVAMSICVSVIVLHLHHQAPYHSRMKRWQRKLFLEILPRLLCMNIKNNFEASSESESEIENMPRHYYESSTLRNVAAHDTFTNQVNNHSARNMTASMRNSNNFEFDIDKTEDNVGILKTMKELTKQCGYFTTKMKREHREKNIHAEWKCVAIVIDRMFVWIASISFIVAAGTIVSQRGTYTIPETN
ncbi:neuronal acetylcholine receptor subunit alpha-3-like isoform X2 [Glandiceps talaboti]